MRERKSNIGKGPRDSKKQKGNVKAYFGKHRTRLQSERNGERRSVGVYEIMPQRDLDKLNYKKGIWELNNVLIDKSRYFESIEKNVNDYFLESTKNYVDQRTLSLHVIPYTHRLFPDFFTLNIVVRELYLIPRILDYHCQHYLNKSNGKENTKENRIAFLDFLEYKILDLLHVRTPFDYVKRGDRIVTWLREKRKMLQTKWPYEEMEAENEIEEVNAGEILHENKLAKFQELEMLWMDKDWLQKDERGNYKWPDSKKALAIAICLMNEKKYFLYARNIFDKKHYALRRLVKQFFENRYQIELDQYLEPSRVRSLKFMDCAIISPYNLI